MSRGDELVRRAALAERIRKLGRRHRDPVAMYRDGLDTPVAVGVVQAIESDGVRIAGSFVPWAGMDRVEAWREPEPAVEVDRFVALPTRSYRVTIVTAEGSEQPTLCAEDITDRLAEEFAWQGVELVGVHVQEVTS